MLLYSLHPKHMYCSYTNKVFIKSYCLLQEHWNSLTGNIILYVDGVYKQHAPYFPFNMHEEVNNSVMLSTMVPVPIPITL